MILSWQATWTKECVLANGRSIITCSQSINWLSPSDYLVWSYWWPIGFHWAFSIFERFKPYAFSMGFLHVRFRFSIISFNLIINWQLTISSSSSELFSFGFLRWFIQVHVWIVSIKFRSHFFVIFIKFVNMERLFFS